MDSATCFKLNPADFLSWRNDSPRAAWSISLPVPSQHLHLTVFISRQHYASSAILVNFSLELFSGCGKVGAVINIYHDPFYLVAEKGIQWEVWSDPDGGEKTGRCIGVGKTEKEAVESAMTELGAELAQLRLTWETL